MKRVVSIIMLNIFLLTGFLFVSNKAMADEGLGVLCRNFRSETVWYVTEGSITWGVGSSPSWWIQWTHTWSTAKCCVMGTDMDGCDFSMEGDDCKSWISRPQKPDNCGGEEAQ